MESFAERFLLAHAWHESLHSLRCVFGTQFTMRRFAGSLAHVGRVRWASPPAPRRARPSPRAQTTERERPRVCFAIEATKRQTLSATRGPANVCDALWGPRTGHRAARERDDKAGDVGRYLLGDAPPRQARGSVCAHRWLRARGARHRAVLGGRRRPRRSG